MKKIAKIALMLLPVMAISCGQKSKINVDSVESQLSMESTDTMATVDTMSDTASEQPAVDNTAEAEALYSNAVSISVANKSKVQGNCEGKNITLTCTVTNNTPIAISASDYRVSCSERYARSSDGEVPDGYRTVSGQSVDLAPGESGTVTFYASCTKDLSNPKVKMKISRDEFVSRMSGGSTLPAE